MPVLQAATTTSAPRSPTGAYAAQADLVGLDFMPVNVNELLVRASQAIDRALLTAVYDRTKRKYRRSRRRRGAGPGHRGVRRKTTGVDVIPVPRSFAIGKLSGQ